MPKDFLTFGAPDIQAAEIAEVDACLRSGWLGTGPRVARFEADFAAYKGIPASRVAAVNSCTAALHLALLAADLEPGSEVITTPLTFCATINAILHAGLTPVLADVDPLTQNIAPDAIEAGITPRTRALLLVHFAGRPCDMDAILAIAEKHRLVVIEDCAHAIEAEYQGRKIGTLGDFGCFSFYATKNLTTGEGGMLIGHKTDAIQRAKTLALHGLSQDAWHRFSDRGYRHYQVVEAGFKYNMMDIQAAIGLHQLARLDANRQRRLVIWQRYMDALASLPLSLPAPFTSDSRHGLHLFTLSVDQQQAGIDRDTFMDALYQKGVGTGVHYLSVAEHPFYQQRLGWRPEQWPHAQRIGRQTLSLPLSAGLTGSEVERVLTAVRQTLA